MSTASRIFSIGLAGILLFAGCHNKATKQVQQQHGKDTTKAAVDTISPRIAALTSRIAGNIRDADAYWQRGKLEVLQRNANAALGDFTQAINIDSTKDTYYYNRADVYFTAGRTRDSKNDFEKCISLNPRNTDALLKLGEIYFYVRKYKESIDLIDRALKVNRYLAKGYFMKGMIFLEEKDTTKALSSMQTAVEQNTSYFDAYIELGLIYAHRFNPHAIDYYNAALNINPHSIEPYYDKGIFYQSVKDFDKAIECYNQLLQIDSTYKFALYNIGFIHFYKGDDYKVALNYFNKAIISDSSYTMAYYARGNCYEQLKDYKNALADYDHAIAQDAGFEEAKEARNDLKAKMGK